MAYIVRGAVPAEFLESFHMAVEETLTYDFCEIKRRTLRRQPTKFPTIPNPAINQSEIAATKSKATGGTSKP